MANALRHYVSSLTKDECKAIHDDHCEWEASGVIGDGPLRHHANEWRYAANLEGDANVTLWVDQLAKEVWRRFAVEALTNTL
jgi:hypothetical protein